MKTAKLKIVNYLKTAAIILTVFSLPGVGAYVYIQGLSSHESPGILGAYTYAEHSDKCEVEMLDASDDEQGQAKVEFAKAEPTVTLNKWNSEAALKISYPDMGTSIAEQQGNKIIWKGGKEEVHAYTLKPSEQMEGGGLEMEVVLNEKTDTNVFTFQIEGAENFDFFYQPPLNEGPLSSRAAS